MQILVLLSTYNGARFIAEQLASVLSQQIAGSLAVLIRDDGSRDRTTEIIEAAGDARVTLTRGENIGTKASFLALLQAARGYGADYIAFADQDDIWQPGKLARALALLSEKAGPALYCSALNVVDDRLRPLGKRVFADQPAFAAAFFTNCVSGCTCVINRELLDLLDELPAADKILMHDWWLYLLAATFGSVVCDDQSYILHRQHADNQVGMRVGAAAILHRGRMFLRRPTDASRLTQAREFHRLYASRLPAELARFLEDLIACEASAFTRVFFCLTRKPRNRRLADEVAALGAFALGR